MKVTLISSSSVENKEYLTLANEVATYLSNKKYDLIVGGVSSSMMQVIYNKFKEKNCNITCNTMECYKEDLICEKTILYAQTFDRLKATYNDTDIIIALPGGTGSLAEIFGILEEIRTLNKERKLIIYNYKEFYTPILNYIDELIGKGFNKIEIKDYLIVIKNLDELKKRVSEIYE